MTNTILDLEKSLLKIEFMTDIAYLDEIFDDKYIEIGKSGKMFNKQDEINALSAAKEDRKIDIYNFTCDEIGENVYMIHYITKDDKDNIFRTSIWKKKDNQFRLLFHQASLYKEIVNLIKC